MYVLILPNKHQSINHVSKNESHRNMYPDSLFDNTFTVEKTNACTPLL